MKRYRQRRLSASLSSRVLLLVSSTSGRCTACQRAQLGHADLEVAQDFEQEGFELGVGPVDLVDQQDGRLLAQDGPEQRTLEQEAHGEEDIFLACQPVGGLGQAAGA